MVNLQSLAVQYGLENQSLPNGYSIHTEVDALRRTLESMRVLNADIIGMSHGGVIALVFALANPERVRTLTLIEPRAFWMLPNHGYDDTGARAMNESLLRTLPRAEGLELGAGHNSPAADPEHFVSEWQRFEQRATAGGVLPR